MSDAYDRVLERIRQGRALRTAQLAAEVRKPVSAEARVGLPHVPGARVLDTVTGEEGEVVHGARENLVVSDPRR